jgi:uncharacterized protein YabN with tetrapyrrole methylase and pyrophosphatase domain
LRQLLKVMAVLRSPGGCPWDREQDHHSLREHAIEEVYELVDAIEAMDDLEIAEELGDLLLQVVFHCQLGHERGAFDFDKITQHLVDKLVRRHPHVFGNVRVRGVDDVWANWDQIKHAEKVGTRRARPSGLDGIPRHLPALMRAEKLVRKAKKLGLPEVPTRGARIRKRELGRRLFEWAVMAQQQGWSAEELLRDEVSRRERAWRQLERRRAGQSRGKAADSAKPGLRSSPPR